MANRVFKVIEEFLVKKGRSIDELQNYLRLNGIHQPVESACQFANAAVLRVIASFLEIPPSELISLLGNNDQTARAFLDEKFPNYKSRLNISKEDAWRRVESEVQFKGRSYFEIRSRVELVLDALLPPSGENLQCDFLNCPYGCITKCRLTGRPIGA